MSAPARISQADIERAAKVAQKTWKSSGVPMRVVLDLKNKRIELIVGDAGAAPAMNEWDDE
ncbi:hypothetical protein [Novosphingobium sp. M1R2S20]|uniref:Uncharacterized protein n=1 Tax=Novosphingobium rhizovicinum TaxID=3228928 RepID=A0ABV3RCQ8_9SPHN